MDDRIRAALDYARKMFLEDSSGHDLDHTKRVYRTAVLLAEREGADLELAGLIALLHDVDDVKLFPETNPGLEHAVSFLRAQDVPDDRIDLICAAIRQISFAGEDSVIPDTPEGKCVQDADRLDALGAIGIARAFAYGGAHHRKMFDPEMPPMLRMSREEYRRSESTTVNHFYEKLLKLESMMNTQAAKAMAAERTAYMRRFLKRFFREWDGREMDGWTERENPV